MGVQFNTEFKDRIHIYKINFDGALSFRVKWKVNPVVGFEA